MRAKWLSMVDLLLFLFTVFDRNGVLNKGALRRSRVRNLCHLCTKKMIEVVSQQAALSRFLGEPIEILLSPTSFQITLTTRPNMCVKIPFHVAGYLY